jgi:selenocysteine lyase/cysteine desulfurase
MAWFERASQSDKRGLPGMVRISFGCYNDRGDVDRAVHALERVVAGDYTANYRADLDGSFHPVG